MIKYLIQILLYLFMIAWFFMTIAGYEFSLKLKPFKIHLKIYDWQGMIILIAIVVLFFAYGYICQERGKKQAIKETTEQIITNYEQN
ncbi:hypothetical protein OU798_07595 [Prolixibacteraceae bacterium Z1-6]|uniref:Uncharacterized protein n=1 Tax=Draconibacterium aestuarii TaxID=2998507 RepID=A0A9X3F416_9BACT|nr:hypothetical protein [Prolixibacteraceae bacterium Z1-6]